MRLKLSCTVSVWLTPRIFYDAFTKDLMMRFAAIVYIRERAHSKYTSVAIIVLAFIKLVGPEKHFVGSVHLLPKNNPIQTYHFGLTAFGVFFYSPTETLTHLLLECSSHK